MEDGKLRWIPLWQEPPERAWQVVTGIDRTNEALREEFLEIYEWDEEDDAWKPRRDNPNITWIETERDTRDDIYNFIKTFIEHNGYSPSVREDCYWCWRFQH